MPEPGVDVSDVASRMEHKVRLAGDFSIAEALCPRALL